MFVHAVLFGIKPSQVRAYRKDCRIWAGYAKKANGFIACLTVKRHGCKGQYASVYAWKNKRCHDLFMGRLHDWLVSRSKARVKVLGYFNLGSLYVLK